MIWPSYSNCAVRYGGSLHNACVALSKIVSKKESQDGATLAEYVLSRANKNPALVARTVCGAAKAWNAVPLWLRTVEACSPQGKGIAIFPDSETILNAIACFGFNKIKAGYNQLPSHHGHVLIQILPRLDLLVRDDVRNTERFKFLDDLQAWLNSKGQQRRKASMSPWVAITRQSIMDSLRKPDPQDQILFLTLASNNGGVTFLRDR